MRKTGKKLKRTVKPKRAARKGSTKQNPVIAGRVSQSLYDRIQASANKSGRSMSEELAYRAEQALNFEVSFRDIDRYRMENDLLIKLGKEAALMHWKIRPVAGRPGWFFQGDNPPQELVEINPTVYNIIEAVVDRKLKGE